MKYVFLGVFLFIFCSRGFAQVTPADYERADTLFNLSSLVYGDVHKLEWIEKSNLLWYEVQTEKGTEYKIVDSEKQKVNSLFNQQKFSQNFSKVLGTQLSIV